MNLKPLSHLLNIIESTRKSHPNFVLFLGAGASVESGIKTAPQMINEWRETMFNMYKENEVSIDEYLNKQFWYNTQDEYSVLFETLFDEPSQRREYIETCIGDAYPSWGYIYLVNLIRNNVFNTVFTTNFDDLLNEACYAFSSNVRSLVCAHDSSIKSLRITSKRPKIIKLHGDFLFDNLKNTVRELETLENNMLEKFKQYASEFGFIFVGYSGRDRSIMDTLNILLKSEQNFPHGIYWCIRKGTKVNKIIEKLSKFDKVKIIEIEGFDEFFAEINSHLKLDLQPEMSDPYSALTNKLNSLLNKIKIKEENINTIIQKDIVNLAEKIDNTENVKVDHGNICLAVDKKTTVKLPMPYILLADISERTKNYDVAEKYIDKDLESGINITNFPVAIKIYSKKNSVEKIKKILDYLAENPHILHMCPEAVFDPFLIFLNDKKFDEAEKLINIAYKYSIEKRININTDYFWLNMLQIKVHKNLTFNENEECCLKKIVSNSKDELAIMGAYILLKEYSKAEGVLLKIKKTRSIKEFNAWPIINLLKPYLKDPNIFQ